MTFFELIIRCDRADSRADTFRTKLFGTDSGENISKLCRNNNRCFGQFVQGLNHAKAASSKECLASYDFYDLIHLFGKTAEALECMQMLAEQASVNCNIQMREGVLFC